MPAIIQPQAKEGPNIWKEIGALAILLAELCWFSGWYLTIYAQRATPWISLVFLTIAILLSYVLMRILQASHIKTSSRQAIILVWLLLILLFSLRLSLFSGVDISVSNLLILPFKSLFSAAAFQSEFWHLLIFTLMIWRGANLASLPIDQADTQRSFWFGLTMLALLVGINYSNPVLNTLVPVLGFFFFILIALIASRLVEFAYARGGRLPPFTWRWMGNYIFLALGVALVAIILGWLLITPAKFVVSQGLFVVLLVIILAAVVVAAPVFLVLWLLTPWLTRIYEQGWVEMSRIQVPETAPEFEEGKLAQVVETAPNWLITALIIAGILLISAIVIAILVLLRKRQDKMGLELDEDIETVPSRWLRWLPILRRGNRPMAKTARLLAAARIRRMYAELMTFSTRLGKPRPAAQTPLEYLPTLESLFPQQAYELDNLTRAYLKVRYGELPESHEELELLEGQWRILRQEAEHLLRIQRQATLKK